MWATFPPVRAQVLQYTESAPVCCYLRSAVTIVHGHFAKMHQQYVFTFLHCVIAGKLWYVKSIHSSACSFVYLSVIVTPLNVRSSIFYSCDLWQQFVKVENLDRPVQSDPLCCQHGFRRRLGCLLVISPVGLGLGLVSNGKIKSGEITDKYVVSSRSWIPELGLVFTKTSSFDKITATSVNATQQYTTPGVAYWASQHWPWLQSTKASWSWPCHSHLQARKWNGNRNQQHRNTYRL